MESAARSVDVVVIGAGQAGLSAAYHLRRRGVDDVAVLDAEDGPGGAWRHRWESLTMATVNGIRELPGMPAVDAADEEPARHAVPAYFADFERRSAVPVERPVRVRRVEDDGRGGLLVRSEEVGGAPRPTLRTRAILNATGTWSRPFVPSVPGAAEFHGRQLHTVQYPGAAELAGQRVGIVGGGISAVGFLLELEDVASTVWYTRREPVLRDGPFTQEAGRRGVASVAERVRQGLPVRSVVSATGLVRTPALREAERRGLLARREMFTRLTPTGVLEADGTETPLETILWATGFRHELRHLAPLSLHGARGGIAMDGTAVAADPRILLLGYGPSASTIGANRAGRAAVDALLAGWDRRREPSR
ncbi:FAD-dependent oxidoreductase [Brachybacterium sp. YJGR34]|uniref:FAD-dependent oxidoreductase n=1 Tax=Brachybacterium sp. YJGR34 TaxID=2059911 RepID=UPI000E0C4419|nr:FAD-dependent oxidoreductase [Brachybacterium sp. YJGR34]